MIKFHTWSDAVPTLDTCGFVPGAPGVAVPTLSVNAASPFSPLSGPNSTHAEVSGSHIQMEYGSPVPTA